MAFNYLFPIAFALLIFLLGAGLYLIYYFSKPVIKSIFFRKKIRLAADIIKHNNFDDRIIKLQAAKLTDEDIIKNALAYLKKQNLEVQNDHRQSKRVNGKAEIQAEKGYSGGSDGGSKRREDVGGASPENDRKADPGHAGSRTGDGESDRGTAKESRYFT